MFKFFSPKKSYKDKVDEFWLKFIAQKTQLEALFNSQGNNDSLISVASDLVNGVIPGIGWTTGRQDSNSRFEFIFCPEGNKANALLTKYCVDHAPAIEGWEFYPMKKGNIESFEGMSLKIEGNEILLSDLKVKAVASETPEKVDISIYHAFFPEIPVELRNRIAFIALDELLGEGKVEVWLGSLAVSTEPDNTFICMPDLPSALDTIIKENTWNADKSVYDLFYGYEISPKNALMQRTDLFIGSTMIPELMDSAATNPVANTGAEIGFAIFDNTNVIKEELVFNRARLAERIEDSLQSRATVL